MAAARRPTRAGAAAADVPEIYPSELSRPVREALAELLLSMADDEFVLGFWDSEWTGIAPMLEEDVAFSSLAQDEIGHARAFHELRVRLVGGTADEVAFGRAPEEYRHARLLDRARGDWAFSIARRYLYDTADAVRLEALAGSSYRPLAQLVAKVRREETYHLLHMDAWLRRMALSQGEPRRRLEAALETLWPDALTVFSPLSGEQVLLDAGILPRPLAALLDEWLARVGAVFAELGLPFPFLVADGVHRPTFDLPVGDGRSGHGGEEFAWLWHEFTQVYRLEPGASW